MNLPQHIGIQVVDLTKRYGRTTVLNRVSFRLTAGRSAVVLGANGVGKSTFVRLIAGLTRPSAGEVLVNGRLPGAVPDLGVLFEDPQVYPHLPGLHNLFLLAGEIRLPEDEQHHVLEALGLSHSLLRRKAGAYSFGQRRRLTLAAISFRDPLLWVLDEPTNGLDPTGIKAFITLLKERKEKGKTILLTGQALAAFEELADDVWVLKDGALTYLGEWRTLRDQMPGIIKLRPHDIRAAQEALVQRGIHALDVVEDGTIVVRGTASDFERVGHLLANSGISTYEFRYDPPSLEDFYRVAASGERTEGKAQ
ncbi:MAG: ABC transporter ATP-binding protein [Thermoanaerobacteraceae bacterium]|nr:ABC transporter ATP-binding protein [Thermoanaerobacteraceae bacterium]